MLFYLTPADFSRLNQHFRSFPFSAGHIPENAGFSFRVQLIFLKLLSQICQLLIG